MPDRGLFRILGPMEVRAGGKWVEVSPAKWRTVLAMLLLQPGQVIPTGRLIAEMWPYEAPATAANLISIYVLRLRRLIGDPDGKVLITRSGGYKLAVAAEDIDAGRFAQLTTEGRSELSAGDFQQASTVLGHALALWQGSHALTDVPPSPLVSAEASRLEESRVETVQLRIQADLGCGRHAQVVNELRRLLADYPLREELWALLMRALQGSGRQAEALETYAQAREVIAEELGVDPSAELRRLYQDILRTDLGSPSPSPAPMSADSPFATPAPVDSAPAAQVSRESANGPVAARPGPPLAQLPADIPDFTGRAEQIQKLRDLLAGPRRPDSPGSVVVAPVIGAGGLGKTTLAVHAAHLLRANYPDGQLYANLQGTSQNPATPSDMLARFLRDLGMDPARIPAGEEERAAHYRSRLTDQRVLIILDDATDAAHVRPLLPGSASCAVLVTTRNRMSDLAGSRFVELDVLEPAEARNMFGSIIGRSRAETEPEATDEVLTACAGLPLAIRVVGAQLAARSSWSVRTIATRLSDGRRRLDWLKTGDPAIDLAVRACLEVSPGQGETAETPAEQKEQPRHTPAVPDSTGDDQRAKPDTATTPAELIRELRTLWIWWGKPSTRAVARDGRPGGLSHVTISKVLYSDGALCSNKLPRWELLNTIVTGCGGTDDDLSGFASAWRRLQNTATNGHAPQAVRTTRPWHQPERPAG